MHARPVMKKLAAAGLAASLWLLPMAAMAQKTLLRELCAQGSALVHEQLRFDAVDARRILQCL